MTQTAKNEVEPDLEATLDRLRAYRRSDPNFERAIADCVDAEASLQEDPAEGQVTRKPIGDNAFSPARGGRQ